MIVLKTVDLRNDFKKVSDLVMSGEKVLISRPRNENLVVLSEQEYRKLEESNQNTKYNESLNNYSLQVAETESFYNTHTKTKISDNISDISKNNETKIPLTLLKGIFKGQIWMSDDFDEPLEEMEEYM